MLDTTRPAGLVQAAADAMLADTAWEAELVRVYGRSATEARYDRRGHATPTLAQLRERKLAMNAAFDAIWEASA